MKTVSSVGTYWIALHRSINLLKITAVTQYLRRLVLAYFMSKTENDEISHSIIIRMS